MLTVETSLKEAMTSIEGSVAVALVDYTSGMALGSLGGGKDLDLTVAAAANTDVIRAKVRTMEMLGLKDDIEDVLITLGSQYHLMRLIRGRGATVCSCTSSWTRAGRTWPWLGTSSGASRRKWSCSRSLVSRLRLPMS